MGFPIYIFNWRRATGYVILQISRQQHRVMVYLDDQIQHSAICFGTDCECAKNQVWTELPEVIQNEILPACNNLTNPEHRLIVEVLRKPNLYL